MGTEGFELDLSLQVGKYNIEKLLGKGATGTVYLAIDTFTGERVALKTIEPEVFADPEFGAVYRSQFQNEASLAGKLNHPHIVNILDAVVEEDSGHISMEVVSGGDLSAHTTPETLLPVEDVLQIGFKCCGALEYAFNEGIVHRDIKPANLMMAGGTDVKISDFGAAFLRKSQVVQTEAMGSPFYMSPEQIGGDEVTFHSDMYSLGVVLYELLVGQRPFVADTLSDLVAKILNEEPKPPSALRKGLKPEIDRVVLRALKKKADERYESWGKFAEELANVVRLVMPDGVIPDSEQFIALKKTEMLAHLTDAELWELAKAGQWRRVIKTTTIIKENEPGDSFFFLASGQAKVTLQRKLLNLVNEREYFGEMAYIRGGTVPRHATVEAMSEVLLAEFHPATLEKMTLGAQLHLMRALVRNVVDRLALANTRLAR